MKMTKDQIFTAFAIALLLFTSLIDFTTNSLLIFIAVILLMIGWYLRAK
ncbi:hypothetical protein HGB07_06260 [Candidatus Roizmanbacteria bacterium]|nr:hypothetical protein [Candidatus Roizmanbacteria bacterium]